MADKTSSTVGEAARDREIDRLRREIEELNAGAIDPLAYMALEAENARLRAALAGTPDNVLDVATQIGVGDSCIAPRASHKHYAEKAIRVLRARAGIDREEGK